MYLEYQVAIPPDGLTDRGDPVHDHLERAGVRLLFLDEVVRQSIYLDRRVALRQSVAYRFHQFVDRRVGSVEHQKVQTGPVALLTSQQLVGGYAEVAARYVPQCEINPRDRRGQHSVTEGLPVKVPVPVLLDPQWVATDELVAEGVDDSLHGLRKAPMSSRPVAGRSRCRSRYGRPTTGRTGGAPPTRFSRPILPFNRLLHHSRWASDQMIRPLVTIPGVVTA